MKREKRYGIFKEDNGVIYGYCEYSFSMGWETNRVRQWTKKQIQSFFNHKDVLSKPNTFVVRLSRTSNNPIKADWQAYHEECKSKNRAYLRNVPFFYFDMAQCPINEYDRDIDTNETDGFQQ